MRAKLSRWAVRVGAKLMTWGYVERAKLKGWAPEQVSLTRSISMREENAMWDTIRGQILWNKGESEVVAARLARRYDPGMTLNEVANRAIQARGEEREGKYNYTTVPGPPLTPPATQGAGVPEDLSRQTGEEVMRRINGDDRVAAKLRATEELLAEALRSLRGYGGANDHPDRCIVATEKLTRASMVFAGALGDLERVTDVPWTAIMIDPQTKVEA